MPIHILLSRASLSFYFCKNALRASPICFRGANLPSPQFKLADAFVQNTSGPVTSLPFGSPSSFDKVGLEGAIRHFDGNRIVALVPCIQSPGYRVSTCWLDAGKEILWPGKADFFRRHRGNHNSWRWVERCGKRVNHMDVERHCSC